MLTLPAGTRQAALPLRTSWNKNDARVFQRFKPEEVEATLEDIQSKYKECQYLAPKPYVVKGAVPYEDVMFNSDSL